MESGAIDRRLLAIYDELFGFYGPRHWWPARTRFEVIAGAILTQNVSWHNARLAVAGLRRAGLLHPDAILHSPESIIAGHIRKSRFYNQKATKLKAFCSYLTTVHSGSLDRMFHHDTEHLRNDMLSIRGIGRETADSILLYAGRKLSFVCDAYTARFLERLGLITGRWDYESIRSLFMTHIPPSVAMYNEYHALIVHHCYAVCRARPLCATCPLAGSGEVKQFPCRRFGCGARRTAKHRTRATSKEPQGKCVQTRQGVDVAVSSLYSEAE